MIEDNWNYTSFKLSFIKRYGLTLIIKKYLIVVLLPLLYQVFFILSSLFFIFFAFSTATTTGKPVFTSFLEILTIIRFKLVR